MTLFPFFQDIEEKKFLIVGGGRVAREKFEKLSQFTRNITVIAPETDIPGAIIKKFEDTDLDKADVVIGASSDKALNRHISRLCQEWGIPVNIVDDPSLCTFIFPSLIKRGDLVIGISTTGKSPAFSQEMRRRIEEIIPQNTEEALDTLHQMREKLKQQVPDQKERARLLKAALEELI